MRGCVARFNDRIEGLLARGVCHASGSAMARSAIFLATILAVAAGASPATAADSTVTPSEAPEIAQADARVAAVLAGTDFVTEVREWGGDGEPAGATVNYVWSASTARSVADTWPLLRTGATGVPVPPYEQAEHRLRIENLTGLRVDVLLDERRVLQIYPRSAETEYDLREETWPPFSWAPLFTANSWALLPVFLAVAAYLVSWAWRRSRAWNRRLPSMTRHDRQFIIRLSVVLFLLAGIGWQIYETVYAVRAPAVQLGGFAAGDLAALPVLLFPLGLFFAALALEFSPGVHRVAWGLVALLAAGGSLYGLATATFGTAGNLKSSHYILLGVLALMTAPHAFAASRTGWSRKGMPFYS